jgi:hypothetical protein
MRTTVARKWLGRLLALAAPLALWLSSSGCASVHAYQRERLTDRIMSFQSVSKEESRLMKSFESREGSTGGSGGSGGGCACN